MRRGLHHLVVNVLDQLPDAFPIVLVIIAAREQNCGLVHLVEGPFVDELVTDALLAEERDEKEGDVKVHVELDARQLVVLDGGGLRRPIEVVRNLRNVVNEVVDGLLPWNRDAFSPSFKRSCIAAKITQLCKKRGLMKGLLVLLTYYLLKRKVNNLK